MIKCIDCRYQHSSITQPPCRTCITTDDKPGFDPRPPKMITNEGWIRSMEKEELAEWFVTIQNDIADYFFSQANKMPILPTQIHTWLEWFEEEHKE